MIAELTFVKAIKQGNDLLLDVLAAPFGSPTDLDSDKEFFSQRTKFHLDKYRPPAVWLHGAGANPEFIGETVSHKVKSDGVWLRVALDATKAKALEVWNAAKNGLAVASSGSIAHLVRKAGSEILEWPMAEISLWALQPGLPRQSNKRAIAVPAVKLAGYDDLVVYCESIGQSREAQGHASSFGKDNSSNIADIEEDSIMTDEVKSSADVSALVAQTVAKALEEEKQKQEEALVAEQARKNEIRVALEEQAETFKAEIEKISKQHEEERAAANRLPTEAGVPYQAKFSNIWKFNHYSPEDAVFAAGIMQSAHKAGHSELPSNDLLRYAAVEYTESNDDNHVAVKAYLDNTFRGMKADELNQSDLATFGDEWVGVAYSTELWDKVRLETPVAGRLPTVEIPQGAESVVISTASTSPTFYKVAQASDQAANPGAITTTFTTDKLTTANKTLSASKLGAAVIYTGELQEDSVVNFANELRRDLTLEYAEVLESIIIDGDTDTSATTNINDIAGTPGGTEFFLIANGFRKLALVTNTANSADAAGALDIDDFVDTMKLLGTAGINAFRRDQVAFIMDPNTMYATMKLTEVQSRDYISQPVVENGVVTRLFGRDVIVSANMHRGDSDRLANSAGKVDLDTVANNTTGALLCVRWDQWKLGFARRMTIEVDRDIRADANEIVIHSRVGMVSRDNEASAITYNITI